jgi:S1-C subfamily serine protease
MVAPGGPAGNRRTLGVQLEEMKVIEVIEDGAAAKAGVREGDEIVSIGGKPLASREDLVAALQAAEPSTKLVVRRDGKEVELPLTLPARP